MDTSTSDLRTLTGRLRSGADPVRGIRDTKSASSAPGAVGQQVDTVDPADRAAFGEFLRHARERRQVTLEQVANDTKIASRHLSALEQGNVKALPGGMYRRAMLRAYADSIGLDKEAALEQFERTFEPRQRPALPPPSSPAPERAVAPVAALRRPNRPRDVRLLLGIIVVSATAIVGLVTGDETRGIDTSPVASVTIPPATAAATASEPVIPAPKPAVPVPDPPAIATTASETPDPVNADPSPTQTSSTTVSQARDVSPAPKAVTSAGRAAEARAAAPAPAVTRASSGQLAIVTVPAGARVTVNGTGWGVTPVTVRLLPFGSKRVRVTHDGYVSQERVITLSPDRPSGTLSVTLAPR